MTSHYLTVAKATFAASLLRPDVTRITRDEAAQFQTSVESAFKSGSRSDIQTCKIWLLEHIIPSSHRTTALMKYIVTFAKHATPIESGPSKISTQRQILHMVYLLHDLLHHAYYHSASVQQRSIISEAMGLIVPDLFQLAAREQKARVCSRLESVATLWEREQLLPPEDLTRVRRAIADPLANIKTEGVYGAGHIDLGAQETPYIMPATHGDPSLPFHMLPAGNLMPHIIPNKPIAMRPEDIRPLQFKSGPADESLVNVVKDFLKDIDAIGKTYEYLDDEGIVPDIDDLGQLTYQNEDGEIDGDTYYGWSRSFCNKMKAQRRAPIDKATTRHSRSYSSSRSRSPHKRRRFSDSSKESSPFSLPAPPLGSGSITPVTFTNLQRSKNGSIGASHNLAASNSIAPPNFLASALPIPPLGPNGVPFPPPRPPNWNGPWPPPPPPPLSGRPASYGQG